MLYIILYFTHSRRSTRPPTATSALRAWSWRLRWARDKRRFWILKASANGPHNLSGRFERNYLTWDNGAFIKIILNGITIVSDNACTFTRNVFYSDRRDEVVDTFVNIGHGKFRGMERETGETVAPEKKVDSRRNTCLYRLQFVTDICTRICHNLSIIKQNEIQYRLSLQWLYN
jgi:hypothetical protein